MVTLTLVEGPYEVHDFTVADGAQISEAVLLKVSDPRTAAKSVAGDKAPAFAGISATEKEASNGKTELGCYTTGTFLMTAAGGISAGENVVISGANLIKAALAGDLLTGAVVGKALEDIATGTTGEVRLTQN